MQCLSLCHVLDLRSVEVAAVVVVNAVKCRTLIYSILAVPVIITNAVIHMGAVKRTIHNHGRIDCHKYADGDDGDDDAKSRDSVRR